MAPGSPASSAVAGHGSDGEAPSSPAPAGGKFSMSMSQLMTEDEDSRMIDATPEPTEKASRTKSRSTKAKDENAQALIGKIRHLKKEDGEPLWRKDIQYDFLKAIFDDETAVFTNSYEPEKGPQNFADLYIDTMSRSSKTSRVLRDKLLSDRHAAKGMAMVCLLVNIGRMNTTLNFFPEMRAQLRTYHAIPSLQAHQDVHAYKQLQDAPRLKSILKGGAEDREEPSTLGKIKNRDVPRTNPVNLLFVICQAAVKVAEMHFPTGQEFHDLVMKTNYTSKSRARGFLWIMWFYLESDFTEEGCEENPFGSGVDYDVGVRNQGIPRLDEMTPEEEAEENKDTKKEEEFGLEKQQMRAKILEADQQFSDAQRKGSSRVSRLATEEGPAILPRIRPSRESDMDSARSTPPPKIRAHERVKASGRRSGALKYQLFEGASPGRSTSMQREQGAGQGSAQPGLDGVVNRKPRPLTAHQLAVERNRSERVDHILGQGLRKEHRRARKARKQEGAIFRAMRRVQAMGDNWLVDSDPEDGIDDFVVARSAAADASFKDKGGMGGLGQLNDEVDNFGEEAAACAAAIRRASRRLERWSAFKGGERGVVPPVKKPKQPSTEMNGDGDETRNDGFGDEEDDYDYDQTMDMDMDLQDTPVRKPNGKKARKKSKLSSDNPEAGDITMMDEADEAGDKTLAGEHDPEEELDDMERSLLGMAPGGDGSGTDSE